MQHPRRRSLRRRLARLLLLVVLAGVGACAAVVLTFRYVDPPTTAFMIRDRLSADGPGEVHHRWVAWDAISPHVRLAVIAAEDQKFPDHHGFDFASIRSAVEEGLADGAGAGMRGASTISQQVAKNLFLWPGRSFVRKGIEAGFTVLIEVLWPKRRILEVYLNVAQFGDDVYGVEEAAQRFFARPASALGPEEAALLAAVLPNPVRLSVRRPSAYVRERQRWILRQMRQLGDVGL